MDFLNNKDALFTGSSTNIERVEVNQRHLIDKILARYSAEFTVYRELIQNANDAGANEIQIEFKTMNLNSQNMVESIVVKNNGRAFTQDDWRRLKKIAEGNPDEQKIGFFGVGFYTLFSICEEPLVISGSTCLGFYWNGDQLYTKSADTSENARNWTSICLKLREPLELPEYDQFGQFLCKSLLFTYSLSKAAFSVDNQIILKCEKVLSPPSALNFSSYKTASGLFNLSAFESRFVQMSLEKNYKSPEPEMDTSSASSVFSSIWKMAQNKFTEKGKEEAALEAKLRQPGNYHLFLNHYRATASVKASNKFASEMERTTKKKPFQNINIDIIYVNWEQLNATDDAKSTNGIKVSTKHPIFSKIIPFPSNGKVFIGFETHQTSGIGIHFTAPFIPTVERESIDFVDGCLKIWNIELIQMTGRLCRLIYESQINNLSSIQTKNYFLKSKHVMEAFNFKSSTPSGLISFSLFDEFLRSKEELRLPSSHGFVGASQLRHVPEEMLKFVRNTPRIPDEIATECQEFLNKLAAKYNNSSSLSTIRTISVKDVIDFELRGKPRMEEKRMVECLKWWMRILGDAYNPNRSSLTQSLVDEFNNLFLLPSAQSSDSFLALAKMSFFASDELSGLYFSEKATIKFFPIDCISPAFTNNFSTKDLSLLLGLQELNLAEWLEDLSKWTQAKDSIESDPEKAEQLLMLLSKNYESAPQSLDLGTYQARICNALSTIKCIPTGEGRLCRARECYFEDVPRLESSMNILKFSNESRRGRMNETMLKATGVHSHLPLDQIFANINSLKWDHVSLIKYLVRVRDELTKSDMTKLQLTAMFPDRTDSGYFKLSDLCSDTVNEQLILILKLKILKWSPSSASIPKEGSEIGDFLQDLGFNFVIPWRVLLRGVKDASIEERAVIFKYFLDNYSYYQDFNVDGRSKFDFPFIPVQSINGADMSVFLPSQVFLDEPLGHLGFYLLHGSLRKYAQLLGVKERPSTDLIASQIVKVRLTREKASDVFAYCARISNEFSSEDWRVFRNSEFIPVAPTTKPSKSSDSAVSYLRFDQVFLPSTTTVSEFEFADLFDRVDFGVQANSFLRQVGVADEPRAENLIELLLKDAASVLSRLKASKYILLLERIANNWTALAAKQSKLAKSFITSKAFIGFIKVTKEKEELSNSREEEEEEEDDDEKVENEKIQFSLYGMEEMFLIDDVISQQLFNLPTCPPSLEQFYLKLGCRWLSSVIKSEWRWSGTVRNQSVLIDSARKMLSERINLIISSLEEGSGGKIMKGGRKRLEAAKFYQVDNIEIYRRCTVNGASDSQASCAFTDEAGAHPSIYLASSSSGFDHFDFAAVIVNLLCDRKGRLKDSLLVASLLTTPLSSLKAKGFQVEHFKPSQLNDEKDQMIIPNPKPSQRSIDSQDTIDTGSKESLIQQSPQYSNNNSNINNNNNNNNINNNNVNNNDNVKNVNNTPNSLSNSKTKAKGDNEPKRWTEGLFGFIREKLKSIDQVKPGKAGSGQDEESLKLTLKRGIESLNPHRSGDFSAEEFNRNGVEESTLPVDQTKLYCQVIASLRFIGKMGDSDIYVSTGFANAEELFSRERDALIKFYGLIVENLASAVFKISPDSGSIHLYYDPESTSVAFNRNRSLFFNFAHYLASSHHKPEKWSRGCAFWFMTFCHELAHNFVSQHDAQHEFYFSSFAEIYMKEFNDQLKM